MRFTDTYVPSVFCFYQLLMAVKAQDIDSSYTGWHRFVRAPASHQVTPARVVSELTEGNVTNPEHLLSSDNSTEVTVLTRLEGESPASLVLDFGINVVGLLEIEFAGASSNSPGLKLAFSESREFLTNRSDFTRSDNGQKVTDGTDQILVTVNPFTWKAEYGCLESGKVCADGLHGFRYLKITLDAVASDAPLTSPYGTVSIDKITLNYSAFLGTPETFTGWFECSDESLSQYWYDGVYTNDMNIDYHRENDTDPRNAFSETLNGKLVLLDGPKRDRDPYVGDVATSAPTLYLSHDQAAAAKNVLIDLAFHQRADGWIPPASINNYTLPLFDYPLWWIVCSHDLYLYTNDAEYVTAHYSNILRVLDVYYPGLTDGATGLLNKPRELGYGDYAFLPRAGIVTYYNALYVLALQNAASIATWIDSAHTEDAERWTARAEAVTAALNTHLWDATAGAYIDNIAESTSSHAQDGNSLAVIVGAANANNTRAASALAYLTQSMKRPWGNAFYDTDVPGAGFSQRVYAFISYFSIRARFTLPDVSSAFEEMRRLYGWMSARDPGVTMWEGIGTEGGKYQGGFTSLAHGWSTGVVALLSNEVLGVKPTAPGFAEWSVVPKPGDVQWAAGKVPMPKGESIFARWKKVGEEGFELHVEAPIGTKGRVGVPVERTEQNVSLDGKMIWYGEAVGGSGAEFEDGYVAFGIEGGSHDIFVM